MELRHRNVTEAQLIIQVHQRYYVRSWLCERVGTRAVNLVRIVGPIAPTSHFQHQLSPMVVPVTESATYSIGGQAVESEPPNSHRAQWFMGKPTPLCK